MERQLSDNAEGGIARAQAAAAKASSARGDGLAGHQKRGIASLDERVLFFFFLIGIVALVAVWALTTSPLVQYGSLAGGILMIVLWGVMRLRRIGQIKKERAREADAWRSEKSK